LLSRIIAGARISLSIGLLAPVLYMLLGVLIGGFAGYSGGRIDLAIVRGIDLVVALPFLLFMILFRIAFGVGPGESGVHAMVVAMVALSWPSSARLVRGQVMQLREAEYVQAARLLGARTGYLLLRHLIPNTLGPVIVTFTLTVPSMILQEAFLSFLGLGVQAPRASLGALINDGANQMLVFWWTLAFPGGVMALMLFALNFLGDGIRDALDPRMRQ
jgi:oligopeptide transport system permease protein